MKKLFYFLMIAFLANTVFVSCDDDDDDNLTPDATFETVILGAQANTTIDGFYSFNEENTYTLAEAAANTSMIDLFCYYDGDKNGTTLTSAGANIEGIFTGDNAPENWTIQDTTYFHQLDPTSFTVEQFLTLAVNVSTIESLYSDVDPKRKAKQLAADDMFAFVTEDNYYGVLRVISVIEGETGSVEFTYILDK